MFVCVQPLTCTSHGSCSARNTQLLAAFTCAAAASGAIWSCLLLPAASLTAVHCLPVQLVKDGGTTPEWEKGDNRVVPLVKGDVELDCEWDKTRKDTSVNSSGSSRSNGNQSAATAAAAPTDSGQESDGYLTSDDAPARMWQVRR